MSELEISLVAERGRRATGRNASRKTPNHRGLTTTPTDGGAEMCGRITQTVKLETLVAKYGTRNHPELDLTPHYIDVEELRDGAA